jgi:sugar phosphate isomerase/epimerase
VFDTANSLGCLEGAVQVFETLARHVVNVHVKDVRARRNADNSGFVIEGVAAGQGQIDLPDLFARLHALDRPLSAILENWVPSEATREATLEKERAWAAESVAYCRGKV